VRFCANCGTPLETAAGAPPTQAPFQQPPVVPSYVPSAPPQSRGGFLRLLGIGCLVVLAIFVLFGLSCARACLFHRRYSRFGRRIL
jgi:hypothetical protein